MFVLEVTAGPSQGQAIELRLGQTIVVGRSETCTIRFDDYDVSARHAEVSWTEEGFAVVDLDSKNGTYVNGTRIHAQRGLRLGDFIQVGNLILRLREAPAETDVVVPEVPPIENESAVGVPRIFTDKTQVVQRGLALSGISAGGDGGVPGNRMLALVGGTVTRMAPRADSGAPAEVKAESLADLERLVMHPGVRAKVIVRTGTRVDPFAALPVSFGRERSNSVMLGDDRISLTHAVIDLREGSFLVRDVGSSNGTYVNGERVVVRKLKHGDEIEIGPYKLVAVVGPACLGIDLRAPAIGGEAAPEPEVAPQARAREPTKTGVGQQPSAEAGAAKKERPEKKAKADKRAPAGKEKVVSEPLGASRRGGGKGKKKKKASELIWFATSDLDRGVFQARSALIALFLGLGLTAWLLAGGDSAVLAGGVLMEQHESPRFEALAAEHGRTGCAACHVGVGRISTLRCLDCHPHNRPRTTHVGADLFCVSCHLDHRGRGFRSAMSASFGCTGCHTDPHAKLARLQPQLVEGFRMDAPADVDFHLTHHIEREVACGTCHGEDVASGPRGARASCGQCHAPDHVTAGDCQQCHKEHPDRDVKIEAVAVTIEPPPRFRVTGVAWSLGLLLVPLFVAAVLPRKRKVAFDQRPASEEPESDGPAEREGTRVRP